jgi:hypothetical protein
MTQDAVPKPARAPYTDIRLGDIVRMRKLHPCGSDRWEVVRLGADIGIRCQKCARRVLLPRSQFVRQVKALIQAGPEPDVWAASPRPGE